MGETQQHATPIKRTKQGIFLEELTRHGNITLACRKAEINRTTVYRWKEKSDTFLFKFNQALEEAKDNIRAEIFRRGHDGWDEPLYQQGIYCGTIRKYSDTLLIFHAKALMPEYREKQTVDVNQTGATQDLRALQETVLQALANYPEAKIVVAEALMRK